MLEVCDNGVGLQAGADGLMKFGLGTSNVTALASKLGAKVETVTDVTGTRVSIRNAANVDQLPVLA